MEEVKLWDKPIQRSINVYKALLFIKHTNNSVREWAVEKKNRSLT